MGVHKRTKSLRKPKAAKKEPFNIGRAGKEFMPSKFGDARGNEKGWASKLPFFK